MRLGEVTYVCRPYRDAEALNSEMPTLKISATVPRVDDDDASDDRPMPLIELSVPIDMPVTRDEIDDVDPSAEPAIDSTNLSADDRSDGDMNFTDMEFDVTDVIDVLEPIQEDSFNAALPETVLEDRASPTL
ncbi:uncharacterized protein LOC127856093 [Dreissena polymorpha]|uniref:uncharacterized protein LOC127856093 n=1 Tax=Dreissena polymorpha TaxID=45954 RepID=UPI00226444FE|nr:uncharacterized protein LOC127856093 [Dreissena polymorpha]